MKKRIFGASLLLVCHLWAQSINKQSAESIDWKGFLAQHDMVWTTLRADAGDNLDVKKEGYYSGAIMGNGLLGTNLYKLSPNVYRLNASRSDITEIRQPYNLYNSSRLPVGYFTLATKGKVTAENMRLSIYDAITSGTFTTDLGEIRFKTFVHAQKDLIIFETESSGADTAFTWTFVPQKAISPRYVFTKKDFPSDYLDSLNNSNPDPIYRHDEGYHLSIQHLLTSKNGPVGKVYVVAWKEMKAGSKRRIVATIAQEDSEHQAITTAKSTIGEALATDTNTLENSHKTWWHNFYPRSFVSFPKAQYESFYWLQHYKFASATHEGKPIVDLQGPWATFNTPWPAVWINLNLQLTYSWQVKANQGELTRPLWETLNTNKENLHRNVTDIKPPAYPNHDQSQWTDAACLGRTSTYNLLAPLNPEVVSKNQYEVGNLTWMLFYYWQYCSSYGYEKELTNQLFPLLKDAVNLYFHIRTGKDQKGKWNLPPTASPEYQDSCIGPNANYDLAILRWGLKTLLAINDDYHLNDPKRPKWQDFLDNLADYPVDSTGYKISSTVSFTNTAHRHYSHLFMIYPFHLVDWENPSEYEVMNTSVNRWVGNQGYSRTGKAAMLASRGDGDGALDQMEKFFNKFIKPNTLYAETGPVIETPMAAVSTLHEFYLQDWGGKIRVFPAMPAKWTEGSFLQLRTEGAFLISATRHEGRTVFIQVESEKGGLCRLQTDIPPLNLMVTNRNGKKLKFRFLDKKRSLLEIDTKAGDMFQVTDKSQTVVYPAPILHPPEEQNHYGLN